MPTDSAAKTPSERKKNRARRLGRLIHELLFPGSKIMRKLREAENAPPTTTWNVARGTRDYIIEVFAVSDRRPGTVYEWAGLFEKGKDGKPRLDSLNLILLGQRNPGEFAGQLARDHAPDPSMDQELTTEENLKEIALRCHRATQQIEAAMNVQNQEEQSMEWAQPLGEIRLKGPQALPRDQDPG